MLSIPASSAANAAAFKVCATALTKNTGPLPESPVEDAQVSVRYAAAAIDFSRNRSYSALGTGTALGSPRSFK